MLARELQEWFADGSAGEAVGLSVALVRDVRDGGSGMSGPTCDRSSSGNTCAGCGNCTRPSFANHDFGVTHRGAKVKPHFAYCNFSPVPKARSILPHDALRPLPTDAAINLSVSGLPLARQHYGQPSSRLVHRRFPDGQFHWHQLAVCGSASRPPLPPPILQMAIQGGC